MKKVKKFIGFVLAVVMVMAMSVMAFADDAAQGTMAMTGKITISSPVAGKKYTIYKILDVTYNTDKTAYAYTISEDSEWKSVVEAYANEADSGISLTGTAASNQYAVTIDETKFSPAKFAQELKANVTGKTIISKTAEEDSVLEFTGLPLGYYLVATESGALCNLTTTNNAITIFDKNDVPFLSTADKDNVELGEVITYTITGKVPDTTGFLDYTYKIKDTMSEGLNFNPESLEVQVGTRTLTKGTEYTYTPAATGFEIIIPVKDMQTEDVGKEITVTYTATAESDGVAKISKNEATLTYSNNPVDSNETAAIQQLLEAYNARIDIKNYDATDLSALQDAQFIIENSEGKYFKYNTAIGKTEWVEKDQADVFATDVNGNASVNGLKDGSYTLYEIKASQGYHPLQDPVRITIDGKDGTTINERNLTVRVEIGNSKGTLLPSTGGIGTTIFYVLGGILVLGAAVLAVRRRMNSVR